MGQSERVQKLDRLLRRRMSPTKRYILDELQISEATLKRDIEYMRSRLGAPIEWSRKAGGYRYDPAMPAFNLPGFWFSASEIQALLSLSYIVEQIQPGLLRDQIEPFGERLKELARLHGSEGSITDRVFFIPHPFRVTNPKNLETIIYATLLRRRVQISYESRGRGACTERLISPGRILYYRSQWYVDAWCHFANAQRRFAIDAVLVARTTSEPAEDFPVAGKTGYGIFSGLPTATAVLKFGEKAGRWLRSTEWHPDQVMTFLPDRSVVLEVPYSHSQELQMEILRYGSDVEVLAPDELRQSVADSLQDTMRLYSQPRKIGASEIRPSNLKQAS